jgi:hypothetical protein
MEFLVALGRAAGLSLGAGLNLYATLVSLGLAVRFDLVEMPAAYDPLGSNLALGVFVILYLIEFLADKIPWLDSAWDLVHTIVRPLGGAILAVAAAGPNPAGVDAAVALLGAGLAGTSHVTKSSTRLAANVSFLPGLGLVLSLVEDVIAVAMAVMVLFVPLVALAMTVILLFVFVWVIVTVRRTILKRRTARSSS